MTSTCFSSHRNTMWIWGFKSQHVPVTKPTPTTTSIPTCPSLKSIPIDPVLKALTLCSNATETHRSVFYCQHADWPTPGRTELLFPLLWLICPLCCKLASVDFCKCECVFVGKTRTQYGVIKVCEGGRSEWVTCCKYGVKYARHMIWDVLFIKRRL